jgi:hypothetical protein
MATTTMLAAGRANAQRLGLEVQSLRDLSGIERCSGGRAPQN